MSTKTKAFDWRSRYVCFICDKELKPDDSKFLVPLDGWHKPVNMYIHRGCYDRRKIKAKVEELNFGDGV